VSFTTELYKKQKALWDQKIGSEVQFLNAKNNMDNAIASLNTVYQQNDMYKIKALYPGVVDEVSIKLGQTTSPGMPAFRIVGTKGLKLKAEVPESYINKVKQGNSVQVYMPDLDKEITGKVNYVSRVVDPLNRSFTVEINIPDGQTSIKTNMIGVLKIRDYKNDKAISIPVKTLLKNTDGQYFTIDEYKEKIKDNQTDKDGKITVLYSNVLNDHHSYIQAAKTKGYDVLEMDQVIDNHFIQHLEYKKGDFVFKRIDSDVTDHLISSDETIPELLTESEIKSIEELYKNVLKDSMNKVEVKPLSSDVQPVQIVKPEFMRRMTEMQMLQGHSMGKMPEMYTIVINSNHPLIANKLLKMEDNAAQENMAKYLYDLARLSQQMLTGADLTNFINNNLVQMSETSI
jgi:hypothetical protein